MIQLDYDKTVDQVAFNCWVDPPAVYLDHWALVEFSKNPTYSQKFFELFDRKGTLLFSQANVVEIAGNSGDDVIKIRSFLDRVGCSGSISLSAFAS